MKNNDFTISVEHFPFIEYKENNHLIKILVKDIKFPCLDLDCVNNWEKPYEDEIIPKIKKEVIIMRIFNWITDNKKDDTNFSVILRDRNISCYDTLKENKKVNVFNFFKNGVVYIWGKRIGATNELETFNISKILYDKRNKTIEFYDDINCVPCYTIYNPSKTRRKINKLIIEDASIIKRGDKTLYYIKNKYLISHNKSFQKEAISIDKEVIKKKLENYNYDFVNSLKVTNNKQLNANIIISHENKIAENEPAFVFIRK